MLSLSALTDATLIFSHISNTRKRKAPSVIEVSSDSSDVYVFQIQSVLLHLLIYATLARS